MFPIRLERLEIS
ncbi:hypothetical protein VTH06DRAFT_2790 [Thermothelomyces fergusii]